MYEYVYIHIYIYIYINEDMSPQSFKTDSVHVIMPHDSTPSYTTWREIILAHQTSGLRTLPGLAYFRPYLFAFVVFPSCVLSIGKQSSFCGWSKVWPVPFL